MLTAEHRLRRRPEFSRAVRAGRRAGGGTLIVHLLPAGDPAAAGPVRAGFIVGRAVGGAVLRNRTRRRLRHLVSARLAQLPAGCTLVLRALPAAAAASSAALAADLDHGLARLGHGPDHSAPAGDPRATRRRAR